ncbi:hypothetical protein CS0771_69390 [Catellatospora sp. IY07-71]|uniref:hypothetical protein n=1 Tax=Catellatospora sp. IY07-71 TaxID=2728827 RepID=UPI001BB41955|nr:hypothetical protein [Catellatospora sp. IY07-71]BCJ77395.1 hypothetical protein CS0771_69390 [Catellatospora sp. IY07-71]
MRRRLFAYTLASALALTGCTPPETRPVSVPSAVAHLEVLAVAGGIGTDLPGWELRPDGTRKPLTGLRGAVAEVTVRNLTSNTALITRAVVTVRESRLLPACHATDVDLSVGAIHDVEIPDGSSPVPFTVTHERRQDVPGGGQAKVRLSVGSRTPTALPWTGVVDIVLEHDNGLKVQAGPVALVGTGSNPLFYPDGGKWVIQQPLSDRSCVAKIRAMVAEFAAIPGVTLAAELRELETAVLALDR